MRYPPGQTNPYWATLNQYVDTAPNSYIRMRRAGNNRQLANPTDANANNIGRWTVTNKTERARAWKETNTSLR